MGINWLGKFLLIDAAYKAARGIMKEERGQHQEFHDEPSFSSIETRHMIEAAEKDDYITFKQIYTERRPRDTTDRIDEYYRWLKESRKG